MTERDPVARAWHLIDLGRPAEALDPLHRALAEDPNDLRALLGLTVALVRLDRAGEALQQAERVTALAPDTETGHRLRSVCLAALDRHDEAVRAAITAVRAGPLEWETHAQYASAASHFPTLGGDAIAAARRAVELAPHEPEAHFCLGVVADGQQRHDLARECYQRTLALDPQHAGARNNLTLSTSSAFTWRQDLGGYTAALGHDPAMDVARENVGWLAYRLIRRIYWASLATFLVCGVALRVDAAGSTVARVVVGALALGATALWTWRMYAAIPTGVRMYLSAEIRRDKIQLATALLAALMLVAAALAAFTPLPVGILVGLVWVIGLANIALVVAVVVRGARA